MYGVNEYIVAARLVCMRLMYCGCLIGVNLCAFVTILSMGLSVIS